MGRGKVEMKRIEAKSSRQVTFSKRKGGLMKKAKELAVLCDVEIGIVIFSGGGKLYEFASGGSLTQVFERYIAHKDAEVAVSNNVDGNKKQTEHKGANLLQLLPRHLEEKNLEQMTMPQVVQLERQLYSILRHARNRKEKLMAEAIVTLHQKSSALAQENREMRQEFQQLAAASSTDQGQGQGVVDAHNNSSSQEQEQEQEQEGSAVGGFGPDLNNNSSISQAANDTTIGLAPPQAHRQTPPFLF